MCGTRHVTSVSLDGHAIFVDLDVDAALALLIVEIGGPDAENGQHPDQDEQKVPVHYHLTPDPWERPHKARPWL